MSLSKTVENVYLRHEAVHLSRRHLWRLLGMTLIFSLISVSLDRLLTWLGRLLISSSPSATAVLSATASGATVVAAAGIGLISMLISSLVSAGLLLGYNTQFITAGRGGVPKVLGIFYRMRYFFKGWRLDLLTGLKFMLWLLPGLLAFLVSAELYLYEYATASLLVNVTGIVLILALGIPAFIRYSLATYIMADEPDRGVRECITFSKGLTQGRKWQLFKLGVPMLLKMLGMLWFSSLIASMGISVLGKTSSLYLAMEICLYLVILPCVYFFLQLNMAYVLFYLKRREPTTDTSVSYWLREELQPAEQPVNSQPEALIEGMPAPDAAQTCAITDAPAESAADSPEDIPSQTNEEKESNHE